MNEVQKKFGLTPRETEVAELLSRGQTRKSIAQRLGIAICTVDDHLASLRHKINADSTWGLAFVLFRYNPPKRRARQFGGLLFKNSVAKLRL